LTRLLRQFCAGLAVTIVVALQFQDAAPTGSLVTQNMWSRPSKSSSCRSRSAKSGSPSHGPSLTPCFWR